MTITRRRSAVAALTVAALIAVFVGLLPQFADYNTAWRSATSLPAAWLALLVVAATVALLVPGLQWKAAIAELGLRQSFSIAQTSFTVSNGIPGGGAVVLPVQYSMLASFGVRRATATAATGVTAVWNLLGTVFVPLSGLILLLLLGERAAGSWLLAGIGVSCLVAVVVVLRFAFRSDAAARRVGRVVAQSITRTLATLRLDGRVRSNVDLENAASRFRASTDKILRRRWALVTGAQLAAQLTQFAVLAVALAAIQRDLDEPTRLAAVWFAFGAGRLGTLIPITPGGLGTVDGLLTAFLVGIGGATSTDALAAVLIWRTATYLPGLAAGTIAFLMWRRRGGLVSPDDAHTGS
ncbi:MAG: flippase-like domain-containing protein [Ilumatobacter sp.]